MLGRGPSPGAPTPRTKARAALRQGLIPFRGPDVEPGLAGGRGPGPWGYRAAGRPRLVWESPPASPDAGGTSRPPGVPGALASAAGGTRAPSTVMPSTPAPPFVFTRASALQRVARPRVPSGLGMPGGRSSRCANRCFTPWAHRAVCAAGQGRCLGPTSGASPASRSGLRARSVGLRCRLLTPPLGSARLPPRAAHFRGTPPPEAPGRSPVVSGPTVRAETPDV